MNSTFAKYIKNLREKLGYSQDYVANKVGVSRPTYLQIEKGEKDLSKDLSIEQVQKMARIFNVSFDDLLAGRENPEPQINIIKDKAKSVAKESIRISVPQKNIQKFKEVLLYVLEKVGALPNVGEVVLYKLLYFIDFDYYERYEEQLIGATYMKNHHGPTPIEFAKIVTEMQKSSEIDKITTKYFNYDQKKYLPLRNSCLKLLNAQEIQLIDEVLAKHGHKSAKEFSEYSHKDVPWMTAKEGQPIDYESVFYRTPEYSVRSYEDDLS